MPASTPVKTCNSSRLSWISAPANGPRPRTVFQIVTAEAPSTTNEVTVWPPRSAAAITKGKIRYSSG